MADLEQLMNEVHYNLNNKVEQNYKQLVTIPINLWGTKGGRAGGPGSGISSLSLPCFSLP